MHDFTQALLDLIGKRVQLGRGGPDMATGYLMAVKDDYLVVETKKGRVVSFALQHVKSITELPDRSEPEEQEGERPEPLDDGPLSWEGPEDRPAKVARLPATFCELLQAHRGKKIKVYEAGPESGVGFVLDCGSNFLQLVTSPDEVVYYPMFHIRSMRLATDQDGTDSIRIVRMPPRRSPAPRRGSPAGRAGGVAAGGGNGRQRSGQLATGGISRAQ